MDEVYRDYRIAIRKTDKFEARVTHVRGPYIPLNAVASFAEGEAQCLIRARAVIDRYIAFLQQNGLDGEPS